jgi:DNA replication protein DnaC
VRSADDAPRTVMKKSDTEERVRALLRDLRMKHAEGALEETVAGVKDRAAVLRIVERLLRTEADRRRERRIERRIQQSQLPDRPTIEVFDFDFQPDLDRELVMELAELRWIDRREDLLLVGQSGVGKSHLAKALALSACADDHTVRYTTCADLMTDLIAALADDTLTRKLKRYIRPRLLVIDDLGFDPIEQEKAREAQLLYKVLDARHGSVSTIITSNLPVDHWADYLGSHHLTVALLDRLLYHATTISIEGPSYRLAQHQKRQEERKLRRTETGRASNKKRRASAAKKTAASKRTTRRSKTK